MSRGWSTAKQASVLPLILFCLGGGGEEHWLFLLCSYTSTLLEAIIFLWLGFAKENRIKHFSSAFLTHSSSYRTLPEKPVFSANSSSPSHPSARADTSQRHQHSFARSELCLCRLYNALTPKKSFKKGEKNPRRKKLTTLLPHVMDSKPWLTCQFKSTKKPQGRNCWETFFSLISQNEGPKCLLEFFMIACSPHVPVTSRQTSLAPAFPQGSEQRGHPLPSGGSLSPHSYSATLLPSGHLEWPTHWTSNCSGCTQKTSLILLRNRNRAPCFIPNLSLKEIQR